MAYNWQHPSWPHFEYEVEDLRPLIVQLAAELGEVSGLMQGLDAEDRQEAILQLMITEAVDTSAIEGEYYSREDVKASIRKRLGLEPKAEDATLKSDRNAEAVGELMVEVRKNFEAPLSTELILEWHNLLLAHAKNKDHIDIGKWREGEAPMQVVSGALGREVVHFEAPPSSVVPQEMLRFVHWYNDSGNSDFSAYDRITAAVLKSAITHLYFESIHPFDDGNGRIGRALAEKALSQVLGSPVLFSISSVIHANRKLYYDALQRAQSDIEATDWIQYFAQVILDAQRKAKAWIGFSLKKARFYDTYQAALNERQQKAVGKMLEAGPEGFKGGMTASKYVSINCTTKATATRDLQHLLDIGAFVREGAGRSVRYQINF